MLAGGFFDGNSDAAERHAFLVQLLEDIETRPSASAGAASGFEVLSFYVCTLG
jgi:hypothetical protein